MQGTVADPNPKTLENAKRQFVELYGSALVLNTYLKIALVLVSLVALGLLALNFHTAARYAHVKPLVIRIDDVGRAEAVQYDATAYQPQAPELRYFLTQFVVKHFSRLRATVQRDYPESLFFLDPALAAATIAQNEQSRLIESFVTNPSSRRDRRRGSERQSERTDEAAVQGVRQLSEGAVRARDAQRADPPDLHRPVRLRASRPGSERVRPRESARAAGHLLSSRPGVRGDLAMIANSAFLAALTTFVIAAWLAARADLSRAVQGRDLPRLRSALGSGRCGAVSQPLWARTTWWPGGCSYAMPDAS